MVELLKVILGAEGWLFVLFVNYVVYYIFYSFENGFFGERKCFEFEIFGLIWYYLVLVFCSMLEPCGLYGVEWVGEIVVVISDLELYWCWSGLESFCIEVEEEAEFLVEGEEGVEEGVLMVISFFL